MKTIVKIVIAIVVVALLAFTAFYLVNAYNTGKIGNKAEKVSESFVDEIKGSWQGQYSISGIEFKDDGRMTVTLLGISLDGTYSDKYDLETQKHTLTMTYSSSIGVSVTRSFTAGVQDGKLELTDVQAPSISMTYTRAGAAGADKSVQEQETTTSSVAEATTIYNPGADVFKASVLGKWVSTTASTSGFTFVDSSKVTVTLLGVSYDGTYSISVDEATNRYVLKINYVSFGEMKISNSYYASVDDSNLTLTQIGAESIKTTYTKSA